MIRIGQRELEVPLWLWVAVPLAWLVYAAYGSSIYGIDRFNPDGSYLVLVRQCAIGALAGFLLADIARRSTLPWYGVLVLAMASLAASKIAIEWLSGAITETSRTVTGLALGIAASIGGSGGAAFALLAVSIIVPFGGGLILALMFTLASRLLIGLPLWAADTRREFWANLFAACFWLAVAIGGFIAIRSSYGLAMGAPASRVPSWLPMTAAYAGAVVALAAQLGMAWRFRRNEGGERHNLRIWALAVICVAAFIYSPSLFGATGHRLMYDQIRPMLRAAHLLPSPEIVIANYRVSVPFHDFKVFKGAPMPDGKPSYLTVMLPDEYGLGDGKFTPRVMVFRRDIALQHTSTWWTDRRKLLEDAKAAEPGKDAVVRFPGPRSSIGLRSDDYPNVDIQLADFDPAVTNEVAEQALRLFLRERLRRVSG
jgi:hypothetical protein